MQAGASAAADASQHQSVIPVGELTVASAVPAALSGCWSAALVLGFSLLLFRYLIVWAQC
jgi:hypothetical protein